MEPVKSTSQERHYIISKERSGVASMHGIAAPSNQPISGGLGQKNCLAFHMDSDKIMRVTMSDSTSSAYAAITIKLVLPSLRVNPGQPRSLISFSIQIFNSNNAIAPTAPQI